MYEKTVCASEIFDFLFCNEAQVIDLRAGEVPDLGAAVKRMDVNNFAIHELDQDTRYLFLCETGYIAAKLAQILDNHGYDAWVIKDGEFSLPEDNPLARSTSMRILK